MYVLIGAGGHAKVILDILRAEGKEIAGFLDDRAEKGIDSFPLLGKVNDIKDVHVPSYRYIIAIGHNQVRAELARELSGFVTFGQAIHPTAVIGSQTSIGDGTVIMANAVVNHSTKIGNHVIINTAASVDHDCILEDYSHISPGVNLAGNVKVREGAHVGIGACAIPGTVIGKSSIVGAGSTVTQDIPSYSTAVGCPAKVIKQRTNT